MEIGGLFLRLVAAWNLDYDVMKQGTLVCKLELVEEDVDQEPMLYSKNIEYGLHGGLRRFPNAVLKFMKRTVVPKEEEAEEELSTSWGEVINATISGKTLNTVEHMVVEMITNRRGSVLPLIYQPYIMALVMRKVTDFRGNLETEHQSYELFNRDMKIMERLPSPVSSKPNLLCSESMPSFSSSIPSQGEFLCHMVHFLERYVY
jgi:hypothetical protein